MFNFENQIAIITGGTRGIGAGLTKAYLKAGATVIATYASNDQAAQNFKEELSIFGEKLQIRKFNVANKTECENFFQEFDQKYESLHILINNSGIRKDSLAASMSENDWDQVMDINLKGSFMMSQLAILRMMKSRYGRIINMSSVGGKLGLSGQANYAASKAGQVAISKVISKEVAKRNITINNVAPGFIETELLTDLAEDLVKEYKAQVPMKRFGTVDEVAHAVMFLSSKEASYITGATIEVTGGL